MMCGNIGTRIVGMVLVVANRDQQIGIRGAAESSNQIFQQHAADLRWAGEVGVIGYGVGDLRQIAASLRASCSALCRRQTREVAADFEIRTRDAALDMRRGGSRVAGGERS